MKKSKSVFLVFSQLVLPAVLFGQNIGHRNLLHFNLENNRVGSPKAILETASRGRTVIYQTAASKDPTTGAKLGRATVEDDGVTWRVENDFLDAAKLSLKNDTSVTGGDVLRKPKGYGKEHYVIAYSTRQENSSSKIHTGFSSEEFEVALTKKGYEADGLFPSLFEYMGVVYITYVRSYRGVLKIARAEADAEVEYEIPLLEVCMNPRFFHLDGNHFALVTSVLGDLLPPDSLAVFRSYFSIWRATKNDGKISFSRDWDWRPFDFGRGATHFAFSHDDRLTAIGSNYYNGEGETEGLTLLRKISFDPEFGLLKQDPLIDVNPSPSEVWDGKLKLEKDDVKVVDLGRLVGAVFLKLNFTGLTSEAFIRFKQKSGDDAEDGLSVCMRRSSDNEGGLELFVQAEGGDLGTPAGDRYDSTTTYLSYGREKTPIMNATLNVILDKSTVEIYGADGYLVITESYCLTNSEPFSVVTIQAKNDVTLEGRISVLRDTSPPTTTPSPPTTKPSPPTTTTTASFATTTTTTTATPRKATTLEESSGSNVVMSMVLLGVQYITYV